MNSYKDTIKTINSFKYSGIYLDANLKYQPHIDDLCVKISRCCGLFFRLGISFTYSVGKIYYYAFFYVSISCCISIWGGVLLCTARGKRLKSLQCRIIKNLFSKFHHNLTYDHLLKEVGLLKIRNIY